MSHARRWPSLIQRIQVLKLWNEDMNGCVPQSEVVGKVGDVLKKCALPHYSCLCCCTSGQLISRLYVDCTTTGKAVTNNVSDGLRAFLRGGIGLGMMVRSRCCVLYRCVYLYNPVSLYVCTVHSVYISYNDKVTAGVWPGTVYRL